jgi:hypothetical protein
VSLPGWCWRRSRRIAAVARSYPCAIEHEGKLYVGYSNSGGRGGNHNSAELAIMPLKALQVE